MCLNPENGSVYTWGQALASDPDIGRLGYSCTRRSTVPKKVDALKDHCAVMVACGHDHTMGKLCPGRSSHLTSKG